MTTTTRAERTAVAAVSGPYTPADVAALFGVDPKTVRRWAIAGKIPTLRTLGGHRRYPRDEIDALLSGTGR